jgi:hypothetical protein
MACSLSIYPPPLPQPHHHLVVDDMRQMGEKSEGMGGFAVLLLRRNWLIPRQQQQQLNKIPNTDIC